MTPWNNPEAFEELFLQDVLDRKINTSECNLWDGNTEWVSKTIDPYPHTVRDGKVTCLYSGVAAYRYPLDRIVYLRKV